MDGDGEAGMSLDPFRFVQSAQREVGRCPLKSAYGNQSGLKLFMNDITTMMKIMMVVPIRT